MYKSKRSRACDIKKSVKDKVWERDKNRCIICQSPFAMPNAHFIPRSKGGLGIEQNIVTLCQECHHITDQTEHRQFMLEKIEKYLKSKYDDWDKEDLIYRK
jgi:5-methylcytosine-specific restriction endonuclease McrA